MQEIAAVENVVMHENILVHINQFEKRKQKFMSMLSAADWKKIITADMSIIYSCMTCT